MRSLYFFLLTMTVAVAFACGPKEPSYSNINLNKNRSAGVSPEPVASPDASASATPGAATPPAGAATPPAPAQPGPMKIPAFFDAQKGAIKDLPSYPESMNVNVQYGPLSNAEMATIVSETSGSMEKITQFYDKAIKSNGWTVSSETRETDRYRMNLKKGDKDAGTVQVTRNAQSKAITIVVSRSRAL
jgi:hypothetical protein